MKRVLFTICAVLVGLSAFAGNPVKVVKSNENLKGFMKKDVAAVLIIDWAKTKFDNKKAASAEFGKDWAFIKKDCAEKFIEEFNDKSKGIKLQDYAKGAKYKFVFTVTNVDDHVNVMGYGPRTEAKIWGTLKIVEAGAKGKTIAEIQIDEAEDGVDYVRKEAYGKTMKLLAKRIAKLK